MGLWRGPRAGCPRATLPLLLPTGGCGPCHPPPTPPTPPGQQAARGSGRPRRRSGSRSSAESRDAEGRAAGDASEADRGQPPSPPATFTLAGFPLSGQPCLVGYSFPGRLGLYDRGPWGIVRPLPRRMAWESLSS